ncbi:MAG TPA: hypothetical protein VM370_11480, partial [Candidatus Thermoplasmatota archaeon]|nr:hypothetical protein [Candidatus Thermoplasmatota archaeon]
MLGRALGALAIVLVAGLSGCIRGNDPAEEQAANETVDNVIDANDTVTAPDGRGDISAFKETNKTEVGTGGMMHSHDYWNGQTRLELFTDNMWFIPLPAWPCRSGNAPDGDCYNPGTSIADIDLPAPTLVYEGTGAVEILFKDFCVGPTRAQGTFQGQSAPCVPNPQVKMGFDYLTAADEPGEWRTYGLVDEGTPVVIPVKPDEADMPHQAKSFWLFRIYTDQATSVTFNFTVTAVKGNSIVDWPPHPDLYADKTTREILNGPFTTDSRGWADFWITGNDGSWVNPDRVISYGTDSVEVFVTKKAFSVAGGLPIEPDYFYLDVHNASFISKMGNGDLVGARVIDEGSDGTTYHFTIPVTAYDMDTPYGQKSRWGFRFAARFADDGCPDVDQSIQQGCQWFPYTLDYDMKILA